MEIKYNYKELKKKYLGVYTFSDLYNPKKIQLLFMDFIKRFDKLVIVDNRFTSNLSEREIEYLGNQLEYTYWNKKFGSSSTKYRYKKKFREFIQNKNLTSIYHYLKQEIQDKYYQLSKDCEGVPIHISE